jgi:phospholipid-translocating ATPase
MKDGSFKKISAANIKVGDIIKICQNERVPADLVLLQTTEKSGSVFIRTDQLDGETDWKLRKAIAMTQKCQNLMSVSGEIVANPPNKLIYDFKGYFESADVPMLAKNKSLNDSESMSERTANLLASAQNKDVYREALSLENTMWANTVLASSGHVLGMIVFTGIETRAQMNSKAPLTKVGKLDIEINRLSKFLFVFMILLSLGIVALSGFVGNYLINFFRFVLLLSAIIPISLRVNLDLGKVYYCVGIYNDT